MYLPGVCVYRLFLSAVAPTIGGGEVEEALLCERYEETPPGLAATVAGPFEGVKKLLELSLFLSPDDPPDPFDEPKERENALDCCLLAEREERGITRGEEPEDDVGIALAPGEGRGKKAGSSSPGSSVPICTFADLCTSMGGALAAKESDSVGRSLGLEDERDEATIGNAGLIVA